MQENNREVLDVKNIDQWVKLAKQDPAAFEARRQLAIEAYISSVPEAQQRRLRGLQWKIDMVRKRSSNPLSSCMAISNMMWDSVQRFVRLDDEFAALQTDATVPAHIQSAKVLSFPGYGN
jgi:hypothetical protein